MWLRGLKFNTQFSEDEMSESELMWLRGLKYYVHAIRINKAAVGAYVAPWIEIEVRRALRVFRKVGAYVAPWIEILQG